MTIKRTILIAILPLLFLAGFVGHSNAQTDTDCGNVGYPPVTGGEPPCDIVIDLDCEMWGQVGVWPNCTDPVDPEPDPPVIPDPPPSCADFGQLGTYPDCYNLPEEPPPSCADYGLLGTYPDCYAPPVDPDPTCADSGQLGTYPDCYNPPADPTCADSGQLGTYPDCYDDPGNGGGDPTPTATLTANPNPASGNTVLTWTSTNATSCTGVGASFSTGGATSGSDTTVTPGFTYQVQCTGPGGNATAQVVVGVIGGACQNTGPLDITAAPSRIQPGDGVTLSWSADNIASASCTVTNLGTGALIDSATASSCAVGDQTASVADLQAQTTFRLTCGTLTKDVVVNVVPRFEEF